MPEPTSSHLLNDEVGIGVVQCTSMEIKTPPTRKRAKTISAKRHADSAAITQLLILGECLQRKQRQEAQKRYSKKKAEYVISLDNGARKLREDVKMLEQMHRCVPATAIAENVAWGTVVQYFRLIHCGRQLTKDQVNFFGATMAPDVIFNGEYGLDAVVRSWCFSQWFDNVEVELKGLQKPAEDSLIATTKISLAITEQTLCIVFPHLRISGNSSDNILADMVLDQRIVLYGSTSFKWNRESRLVASMIA